MSVAVLDRKSVLGDLFEPAGARPGVGASDSNRTDEHGGLTLDELITGVWEGLAVRESVHCPACGGTMVSRSAVRADAHEGDCKDCGARIY